MFLHISRFVLHIETQLTRKRIIASAEIRTYLWCVIPYSLTQLIVVCFLLGRSFLTSAPLPLARISPHIV
jgi:hypothetical protein